MMQLIKVLNSPLYKNSVYLIVNAAITTSLGFFFWIVVARFYSEDQVGYGSAIVSAVALIALFSRMGLGMALIRFLPSTDKPVEMINSSLTLSGIISLVLVGVFIAGIDVWSPALSFIKDNAIFVTSLALFAVFLTLSGMLETVFIARRKAGFILAKNTIVSLLKIPLPIILVMYFRAFGIVSSWGIAVGIAVAISLFYFLPRVQNSYIPIPQLRWNVLKGKWMYSLGNHVAMIFDVAPGFVLSLIVVNRLGAEQNAYFYIAWMIITLLFAIPDSVCRSLFAESSHFEDELEANARRSLKFIYLLIVPAIIVLVAGGKWLLLLFGWVYSVNAYSLLWILALSGILVSLNRVYAATLRVKGRIRELMILSGFIAIVVILVAIFASPTTGIVGIGYGWIAAHGIVSVYVAWRMKTRLLAK